MEQLNVIPYPSIVEHVGPELYRLPRPVTISCCAALQPQAEHLQQGLQQRFSTPANVQQRQLGADQSTQAAIRLQLVDDLPALWPFRWAQEGYELVCNAQGITITALSNTGIFYGIQTVLQAIQVSQEQQALCMPYTLVGLQCPRWQPPTAVSAARRCHSWPE
jgi:N-acetyl-beta-hexosaminidase